MINDGKSISIANLGGLYHGRTIRFSPLMNGGLEGDEDHAFTVNGDGDPQLLQFDNDCATIVEPDGSIVRLDVRNYRMTILPYHVRFNDTAVDSDGTVVRNYMMANDDGNEDIISVYDYRYDNLESESKGSSFVRAMYKNEIVLRNSYAECLIGSSEVTDRELLRMAGYVVIGMAGDETNEIDGSYFRDFSWNRR